jgi:hypothetical protein
MSIKYVLIFLLFMSCAHKEKKDNISVDAILNLATASYIRGCVDSKNHFIPEPKKTSAFQKCKIMSKDHRIDIRDILIEK